MKLVLSFVVMILLAVSSCVNSADVNNKYNMYYDQKPVQSYNNGYNNAKASAAYSSAPSKTAYTSSGSNSVSSYSKSKPYSYLQMVEGLTSEELEQFISKLYSKIQITTHQIDSVLIILQADTLFTSITPGTLKTDIIKCINNIAERNLTSNIEVQLAAAEALNTTIDSLVTDYSTAFTAYTAAATSATPALGDINTAFDAVQLAVATLKSYLENFRDTLVNVVNDLTDLTLTSTQTIANNAAISDINEIINDPAFTALLNQGEHTDINTIATDLGALIAPIETLLVTNGTSSELSAIITAIQDTQVEFLAGIEAIGGPLSYLENINNVETASIPTLPTQLLIQQNAQNTIRDAFKIQTKVPALMKLTYEIIFYAESIQNDAIKAGQAAIRIKKLENGPLAGMTYSSNGYGYGK